MISVDLIPFFDIIVYNVLVNHKKRVVGCKLDNFGDSYFAKLAKTPRLQFPKRSIVFLRKQ